MKIILRIEELNLEDNKLGDNLISIFLKTTLESKCLRRLNISKNLLTPAINDILEKFLLSNFMLQELYLHWNKFNSTTGIKVFEALIDNDNLMVLDISWNSLGNLSIDNSCSRAICEFLKKNEKVIHLDMSNNNFTLDESQKIAEALKSNHTIYGFHFEGNFGYVDRRGFILFDNLKSRNINHLNRIHRIESTKRNRKVKFGDTDLKSRDCCWICDGWTEVSLKWNPREEDSEPIYIHFDFEKYIANYMGALKDNGSYVYKRLVPPGPLKFFYTIGDVQITSEEYSKSDYHDSYLQHVRFGKKLLNLQVESHNSLQFPYNESVIGSFYMPTVSTQPRTRDERYRPPKEQKKKRQWSFPISIFKDWKQENEELTRKCFETDWNCSKIPKIIKNPEDLGKVKDFLASIYKHMKEGYKYMSSLNPIGDVWSISQNPFTDFINTCNMIDGKLLKLSDVDIKFIATLSSTDFKGNPRNPERAIIRYQLMEVLVRIAEEKYIKNNVEEAYEGAVKALISDHCLPYFKQFDSQKWRNDRYWKEECDDVLKYYRPVLENVYNQFSKKKVKPGQKKFMSLEELSTICKKADVYDEFFVERDSNLAYNLSMMTQFDELNSDRIFQMSFVEFLEAIARMAEKASKPIIGRVPLPLP